MDSLDRLGALLRSDEGGTVLHTLSRLGLGLPLEESSRRDLLVLAEIGLARRGPAGIELGVLGRKCADAAREYVLWVERGRRIHGEDELAALRLDNFRNQRLLEIGSSWGCNIFRLRTIAPQVKGREIEDVYRRFSSIFAAIEGVEAPVIDLGPAESLPYPRASFDWVLLFSSMQYMDIRAAVQEIARVLVPGGRMLTMLPLMRTLMRDLGANVTRPRAFGRHCLSLANSATFLLLGRRVNGTTAGYVSARPVYLTPRSLESICARAGLSVVQDLCGPLRRDYVLVAEKPRD